MAAPKKPRGAIQRQKKIAATPPQWLELMAQMRQIRMEAGISTRQVCEAMDVSFKVLSSWETGIRAMHPHDLLAWLDTIGKKIIIVDK